MCPLDSRVCLSSGSQSLSRPWCITPASFTGLWKDSSCEGEHTDIFPVLFSDEPDRQREEECGEGEEEEAGQVSDTT